MNRRQDREMSVRIERHFSVTGLSGHKGKRYAVSGEYSVPEFFTHIPGCAVHLLGTPESRYAMARN